MQIVGLLPVGIVDNKHRMRLFFCHVPKAGGQTINRLIRRKLGKRNCLRVWETEFGADVSVEEFVELEGAVLSRYKAVIGHLPFRDFLANKTARRLCEDGGMLRIASVRDPVERLVSEFNYIRNHPGLRSRQRGIPKHLEDYVLGAAANLQTTYLGRTDRADPDQVLRDFEVFPIEDSVEGISRRLQTEFGGRRVSVQIANRSSDIAGTRSLPRKEDLSDACIRRLHETHALDMELYARARSGMQERAAAQEGPGLRIGTFLRRLAGS